VAIAIGDNALSPPPELWDEIPDDGKAQGRMPRPSQRIKALARMPPGITLAPRLVMNDFRDSVLAVRNPRIYTRVFLGEDDVELRSLMASALRHDGHEVLEAGDGLALLRRIQSLKPTASAQERDIVVTDVRMPGASGLDVLAMLRNFMPWMPVVIVTGFGDEETRSRAQRFGAVKVLDKPFPMNALLQVVQRFLFGQPANVNGLV
jgi:CheY-like chemotaxis protein